MTNPVCSCGREIAPGVDISKIKDFLPNKLLCDDCLATEERLKLEAKSTWRQQHLDRLAREIGAYVDGNGYGLDTYDEGFNRQTGIVAKLLKQFDQGKHVLCWSVPGKSSTGRGVGKTRLCVGLLLQWLIDNPKRPPESCQVIDARRWDAMMNGVYPSERLGLLMAVVGKRLLLIDDMGYESHDYARDLLQQRVDSGRQTLITTNMTLDSFQERYGSRLWSRLQQWIYLLQLKGKDYRSK